VVTTRVQLEPMKYSVRPSVAVYLTRQFWGRWLALSKTFLLLLVMLFFFFFLLMYFEALLFGAHRFWMFISS
jgi:hypothetical protein